MKNYFLPLLIATLFLSSCSNGVNSRYFGEHPKMLYKLSKENLAIGKEYAKAEENFNIAQCDRLDEESKVLGDEFVKSVKDSQDGIVGTPIEIEVSDGLLYSISKTPEISEFDFSRYSLKYYIGCEIQFTSDFPLNYTSNDDRRGGIMTKKLAYDYIYFKLLNSKGDVISLKTESIMGDMRYQKGKKINNWGDYEWNKIENMVFKSGTKKELKLFYDIDAFRINDDIEDFDADMDSLINEADLDKIVFITEAEYKELGGEVGKVTVY